MIKKRFIAGAVCPRCAEMDRLQMYTTEEGTFKECVSCGFVEKQVMPEEAKELETRVNQVREKAVEVAPIRLIDPKNKDPKSH